MNTGHDRILTDSDSSLVKCSAIGVCVAGTWRLPFQCMSCETVDVGVVPKTVIDQMPRVLSIGQQLHPFTCNSDISIYVKNYQTKQT